MKPSPTNRAVMFAVFAALAMILFSTLPARAQQQQPQQLSVKRHPNEHLHYQVTVADGDIGKITGVSVHLKTSATPRPDQQGTTEFGGNCQKTNDPKTWTCDVVIPTGIIDGDYQLFQVGVSTPVFGTSYTEDFHVPVVPIENPDTFTPPSKVTVKQQP
ncbi:MAG: hypothetical protein WCD43_09805 [Candidatus Acidiferrales bacterium]